MHYGFFFSLSSHFYLWLYSPMLDLGCFLSFLILYTVGRTPWTGDQPVARTTQTQNKRTQDIHASSGTLLSYLFIIVPALSAV
jgi:hypothetical protein